MNPVHCASKDGTRYVLNSVKIQGDLAIATDGRTLCVVKGERQDDDHERDALIPKRVAKAAWPQAKKKRGTVLPILMINPPEPDLGMVEGALTTTVLDREFDKHTAKDIDGNFPKFEACVPDPKPYTMSIGINVNLLTQIAKSMGSNGVVLHFDPEEFKPEYRGTVLVTATDGDKTKAFGVLMPMRGDDLTNLNKNHALDAVMQLKAEYEAAKAVKPEPPSPTA